MLDGIQGKANPLHDLLENNKAKSIINSSAVCQYKDGKLRSRIDRFHYDENFVGSVR